MEERVHSAGKNTTLFGMAITDKDIDQANPHLRADLEHLTQLHKVSHYLAVRERHRVQCLWFFVFFLIRSDGYVEHIFLFKMASVDGLFMLFSFCEFTGHSHAHGARRCNMALRMNT